MQLAVRHNLQLFDPASDQDETSALVLPVREAEAVMGETVGAYLQRVAWRFELPTVCIINGEYYGRAEWPFRALSLNDNIEFVSRPGQTPSSSGGSAGKSILSIVAMVALTAVAGPLGGLAAGAAGFSAGTFAYAVAASLTSALIVGAGALAISHFLGPKAAGKSTTSDALYNFGIQGNAARPLQPIPVLNGRTIFSPDYAAPTYSEYSGDTMTDYALFALTCGRMQVEELRLGDTPIWNYQTGYNPDYPGIEIQIVDPGNNVTLYPVNVVTATELNGAQLTTSFTPEYIVNPANTTARQLMVDLVWPGGAYVTYKDRQQAAITGIEVQVRPVDAGAAPTGDWRTILSKAYTQIKQGQIRITERIAIDPGRYGVRVRRSNPSVQDSGIAKISGTDDVTFSALRAVIDGPQSFPRVTTLAVKGVASKTLSGISGGQLRVIGTRILPVWNGSQFVDQPTRSIAWAALDWWRNGDYSAGLDITNLDFQAFVAYDALWASLGHTFDYRFTEVQALDDVLETILKAGRSFPATIGDRLTIVREEPRGVPRMLFTENDMEAGSLSIEYSIADESWADGMVGQYLDQGSWRLAQVSSAPDGVTLTRPAMVTLDGVVNRKQATGMVRFLAAETQYRRITAKWTARMEGRLLTRGSLVKLSAEEPETWGQSAEVLSVASDGRTLTVDPAVTWTAGANHYIEIRRRDGSPWGPALCTRGSSDSQIVVNPSGDTTGLADALARRTTQEPPWIAFSPAQPRTFPVLIKDGDPDQDGEHIHLTGVVDAPEVYTTTETGVTPLPTTPGFLGGGLPVIKTLSATMTQAQLSFVLSAGWQPAQNALTYVSDVSFDNGKNWSRVYSGEKTTYSVSSNGSDQMLVRVAGITPGGVTGAYSQVAVTCPALVVSNDHVGSMQIKYEDLGTAVQAQIDQIATIKVAASNAAAAAQDALTNATARVDSVRKALAADPKVRQGYIDPIINDLRGDINILTQSVTDNLQQMSLLRDQLRTAGLEVIPADGRVRFYAIEALQTSVGSQVTNLGVSVDSLSKKIDLYGSVQTSDLSGLISSITTVQVQLNALQGTLSNYVSAAQFNPVLARVSTAETRLDAQDASISTKASQATVDSQGTRITSAEQRISASEGRIFQAVQASSTSASDTALLPQTLSGFIDLMQRQQGLLSQNLALATTNIQANFDDTGRSIAQSSARLLAYQGEAAAQFSTVTKAIADTNSALVQTQTLYDAMFGTVQASIASETTARASADMAMTIRVDGALSRIGTTEANLITEQQTRASADDAFASNLYSLTARTASSEANITSLGQTVANNAGSTATQFQGVSARFGNVENRASSLEGRAATTEANVSSLSSATASADVALGQRIDTVTARLGNAEASAASEVSARASAVDALSQRIDTNSARIGNAEAAAASETQARASADNALTSQYNGLLSRVGNFEAGVSNEAQARASGDSANASNITQLFAQSNAGTAFGRFGMSVASAPSGVSVRLAAVASTDSYGQQRNAGWYLDLLPNGQSRFVVDANFFALTANGGVTYPFTFDGNTLTVPNLVVTGNNLQPGAASASLRGDVSNYTIGSGQGTVNGADPNIKQNFNVISNSYPTLISINATFNLAANSTLSNLQLLVDGGFATNILINGSSASISTGGNGGTYTFTGIALVYLSVGQHTFGLQRTYSGATAGSSCVITTLQWAGLNWRA